MSQNYGHRHSVKESVDLNSQTNMT